MSPEQERQVADIIAAGEQDYHEIAADWLISRRTIARIRARYGITHKPVRSSYRGL